MKEAGQRRTKTGVMLGLGEEKMKYSRLLRISEMQMLMLLR